MHQYHTLSSSCDSYRTHQKVQLLLWIENIQKLMRQHKKLENEKVKLKVKKNDKEIANFISSQEKKQYY